MVNFSSVFIHLMIILSLIIMYSSEKNVTFIVSLFVFILYMKKLRRTIA